MNKYTLLAATAILSMSAMAVNAETTNIGSANMDVKVRVVAPSGITLIQNIDFGTIIRRHVPGGAGGDPQAAVMNPTTGVVTGAGYEDDQVGKNGIFTHAYEELEGETYSVSYPDQVELTNTLSGVKDADLYFSPNVVKTKTENTTPEGVLETYSVGGSMHYTEFTKTGDYTGSFTITSVLTTEDEEP